MTQKSAEFLAKYGRSDDEWDRLADEAEYFLIEQARLGRTTNYTALNAVLVQRTGLPGFDFHHAADRAAIGHLLYLVVQNNYPKTGLMLSSLVWYLDENDAGSGFYALATQMGLLTPNPSRAQKDAFWTGQVGKAMEFYTTGGPK